MTSDVIIQRIHPDDAPAVAVMVGELLAEIMDAIGMQAFNFDLQETAERLETFIGSEKYAVFVARNDSADLLGFVALCESHALYAEGAFGIIPEFYVRPEHRCRQVGHRLAAEAKSFALTRGWKRLEVTTPPLPQFDRTLAFYAREGFSIAGGRKLKTLL